MTQNPIGFERTASVRFFSFGAALVLLLASASKVVSGDPGPEAAPELKVVSAAMETNGLRLTWRTVGARSNVVQVAPEPYDASFMDLSETIVLPDAEDVVVSYLDRAAPTNAGCRFYRIREEPRAQPSSAERLQWWREARFGMFIHWNMISLLGS